MDFTCLTISNSPSRFLSNNRTNTDAHSTGFILFAAIASCNTTPTRAVRNLAINVYKSVIIKQLILTQVPEVDILGTAVVDKDQKEHNHAEKTLA